MNELSAAVTVPVDPQTAFDLFTRDVDRWWRPGPRYWGSSTVGHRFEPWIGGRFVVVHDEETGEGPELGFVEKWEPCRRVRFTWRQPNWRPHELTRVEVRFQPVAGGTGVTLRHYGFDRIESEIGCDVGCDRGWQELLSHYAAVLVGRKVAAPTTTPARA